MSTDWLARELSILSFRLKKDELDTLGSNMGRVWAVHQTPPAFRGLLHAIDEADNFAVNDHTESETEALAANINVLPS